MPGIDYKADAHRIRWPMMMRKLKKMTIRRRQNVLIDSTSYHSGEDRCNSVYMGGRAHASLRRALGSDYPGTKTYDVLIREVDEKILNHCLMVNMHTIEYMLAYPVTNCPCCGQIILKNSRRKA